MAGQAGLCSQSCSKIRGARRILVDDSGCSVRSQERTPARTLLHGLTAGAESLTQSNGCIIQGGPHPSALLDRSTAQSQVPQGGDPPPQEALQVSHLPTERRSRGVPLAGQHPAPKIGGFPQRWV